MPPDDPQPESRPALVSVGERTKRFLQAEINNEAHGGISPATIFSATDSLMQWPADDLLPDQAAINEVAYDLLTLAYTHGINAAIADLGAA